jgi:hypothetical protein
LLWFWGYTISRALRFLGSGEPVFGNRRVIHGLNNSYKIFEVIEYVADA